MPFRFATALLVGAAITAPAWAQQQGIAPVPFQQRGIYTTKEAPPTPAAQPQGETLPWLKDQQGKPAEYIPFQRATPYGSQAIPAPLPMERSVPVENIDGIEVMEPAAPATPPIDEANPAAEDPAAPTELTAPLFAANTDTRTPREVKLRVLNKVTTHAEEITMKPGEMVQVGKLEIMATNCFVSIPTSQPDSVALLTISEQPAGKEKTEPKLLFHGWMYASSASLTALEHPVYDVAMIDCIMKTAPVDAVPDDKKDAEKARKKTN
jgi:hypothetical protein